MGRVIRDFDHHAEYLPGRGGVATFDGPQTNVIFVGQTAVSQGMNIAGGTVTNLDPTRGFEVKMDDGKTVWLPANINSRLLPFIKGDKIDLTAAVKSGIDNIQDYGGLGVTQSQIDAIKRGGTGTDTISQKNESSTVSVTSGGAPAAAPPTPEPKQAPKKTGITGNITNASPTKTETVTEKVDNSGQIATIKDAIKATEDTIADANKAISEKESQQKTLESELGRITRERKDAKEAGRDVSSYDKILNNARDSYEKLGKEIDEQKETISTAQKTIDGYKKEIDRLDNMTRTVTRPVAKKATGETWYGESAGEWKTADDSRFDLYHKPDSFTVSNGQTAGVSIINKTSDGSDVQVLDPRYIQFELPENVADLYGKDENFTKLVDDTISKVKAYNDDEERLAQLRLIMSNTNTFTDPRYVDRNDKEVVFVDKDGVIGAKGKEWTRAELSDEFYTNRTAATRAAKKDIGESIDAINNYRKTLTSNLKTTQDALMSEIKALSSKIGELLKDSKNMSTPEIKELQAQRDALNEQWVEIRTARQTLTGNGAKLTNETGENANKLIAQAKDAITLRPYYSENGLNVIDAISDGIDTKVLNRLGIKDDTIESAVKFLDDYEKIDGQWVNKEDKKQLDEIKANSYSIGGELYAKNDIDNVINQYPKEWQAHVRGIIFNEGIKAYNSFADLWQNEIAEDYAWAKSGYSKKDTKIFDEKYTTPEGFIDLDKLYVDNKQSLLDKVQLTNSDGTDMTKAQKQALFEPYTRTENYIKDADLPDDAKDAALNALKTGGIEGYNKWVDQYNGSIQATEKNQKSIKDIWGDDFGFEWKFNDLGTAFSNLSTGVGNLAETIEVALTPTDEEMKKRKYQGSGGGTGLLTHSQEENDIFKQAGIKREPTGQVLFNVENLSDKLANYFESKAEEISKFEDTQFEKQMSKLNAFDKDNLVDRTIIKSLREMTINNVHDLGIIANTIAANMVRMADGDPDALAKTAALGASLLGYVFTLPNKVITDPENGIAETLGVLVPIPGIKDIARKIKGGKKIDAGELPKLMETEAKENGRIDIALGQRSDAIDNAVNLMPKEQFTYNYDVFYDKLVDEIDNGVKNNLEEMSSSKELEKYNKQTNELDAKFNEIVEKSTVLQDNLADSYANTLSVGIRESEFNNKISPIIYAFTDEKSAVKEINAKAREDLADRMTKDVVSEAKKISEIAQTIPTTPAEKVTKAIMNEDAGLKMQSELARELMVLEQLRDFALEQGMSKQATDMDVAIAEAKAHLDESMTFEKDKVLTEDVAQVTRWIDEEAAKTKLFNKWVQDKHDAISGLFDNKTRKQTLKEINSELGRIEREINKKDLTLFAAQRLVNEAGQLKALILEIRTRDANNLGIPVGVLDKIYAEAVINALNAAIEKPSSMFDLKADNAKSKGGFSETKQIEKAPTPEQIKEAEKQLQLNEGFNGAQGITPGTKGGSITPDGPHVKPLTLFDGDKAFDPQKTTTLTLTKEKSDLDLDLKELIENAKEAYKKEQLQKALEQIRKDKKTNAPTKKESDLKKKIDDAKKEADKLKDKTDPESLKKRRELQKKIKAWQLELDKLKLAKMRVSLKIDTNKAKPAERTATPQKAETGTRQGTEKAPRRSDPVYKVREGQKQDIETKTVVTPKINTTQAIDTTIKETELIKEKYQFKPQPEPDPTRIRVTTKITPDTTKTPTKEPPKEPGKPRLPRGSDKLDGNIMPKNSPYGQIAWRQGSLKIDGKSKPVWIVISFENGQATKKYVFQTPKGAQIVKRTPKETFYRTGKAKRATVNIGAMNVTVDPTSNKPLQFTRKIPNNKAINKMLRG